MDFGFSEEQEMLRKSARDFLAKECPMTYVRRMMEDERGFADDQWRKMAELGWMGLILPEAQGGAGLDFVDMVVVLEEMGRVVLPGPFFSTVILGGVAVAEGGNAALKAELLPKLAAGEPAKEGADAGVPADAPRSSEHIAWSHPKIGNYMQTPLVYNGLLYICRDNGIMACHDANTGKNLYKERLAEGVGFTSSPVAGDGSPFSRRVSPTAESAAFGTGFSVGGAEVGGEAPRCFEGSVAAARRASEASGSIEPSACNTSRPEAFAFWIAPRERPAWAA